MKGREPLVGVSTGLLSLSPPRDLLAGLAVPGPRARAQGCVVAYGSSAGPYTAKLWRQLARTFVYLFVRVWVENPHTGCSCIGQRLLGSDSLSTAIHRIVITSWESWAALH